MSTPDHDDEVDLMGALQRSVERARQKRKDRAPNPPDGLGSCFDSDGNLMALFADAARWAGWTPPSAPAPDRDAVEVERLHTGAPIVWSHSLAGDDRPVDLNAVIKVLKQEINDVGEVGIWGDYGPPAAPVEYVVGLILGNAHDVEHETGAYDEENDDE